MAVDRIDTARAVPHFGEKGDSQWLLGRRIATSKAFSTNGLPLDGRLGL